MEITKTTKARTSVEGAATVKNVRTVVNDLFNHPDVNENAYVQLLEENGMLTATAVWVVRG